MKKIGIVLFCLLFLIGNCCFAEPRDQKSSAKAACVMEIASGRVLYAQNEEMTLPMASTTKIMTAIVTLENCTLSQMVTIPKEASGIEGSSIFLEEGEHLTVEQLLYGLMLRSGNDAAVALALHCAGSVPAFVEKMNQKAQELNLTHTHFANPHGLPQKAHYTCALDFARLSAYALHNPAFARIVSTQNMQIPWEGHPWKRELKNKNKLLTQLDGCIGIKTGYTKEAGRCLVTAVKRSEMTLVCVVLNCYDMFEESCRLLEEGFNTYFLCQRVQKGERIKTLQTRGVPSHVEIQAGENLCYPLKNGEELRLVEKIDLPLPLPLRKGTQAGVLQAYLKEECVLEIPLVAMQDVRKKKLWDGVGRILSSYLLVK